MCKTSSDLKEEIVTDDDGAVFALIENGRMMVKVPNVKTYRIPEGVERIERLAFIGCRFETLHVPYTCRLDQVYGDDCPIFGSERIAGCVIEWDEPYSMQDTNTNSLCINDSEEVVEKDHVKYSHNMKRLLVATIGFDEDIYEVPDGVETICDMAFAICPRYLTLIIPRSVKVIGKNVFGSCGGKIKIR